MVQNAFPFFAVPRREVSCFMARGKKSPLQMERPNICGTFGPLREEMMGFEPMIDDIKNRCLTTWLHL